MSIREFPVAVYGNLSNYSETISKARCRIFYKGLNRNSTYISEEFAEKLLATLPYTPIKGIYDSFNEDYTDHGEKRDEGRIYGIVPQESNFAWEKHLDQDGIEREYACVDVLLFTAIYKEAEEIINKPQSMEIYAPSIKGQWKNINGQRAFEYTEGCFLGLQVLGEEVEPCFEGAAFFSLYSSLQNLFDRIKKFESTLPENEEGGQSEMHFNFKLSDEQKKDALWALLNSNYNEENGWVVDYIIHATYDEYVLAYNLSEAQYERVYYTKNEEEETVIIDKKETVFIIDVTEEELNTLNVVRTLNGGNYTKLEEVFEKAEKVESLELTISEYEQKNEESSLIIATFDGEREELTSKLTGANEMIDQLNEKISSLESYKAEVEEKEKKAIIKSYSKMLNEDILTDYEARISEYSLLELDKELAYELKKNNFEVFNKSESTPLIPKDDSERGGIESILSKYRK